MRPKVQAVVTVDTYRLMADCVEEGVEYGWRHAHKHVEAPSAESIRAEIERAVMSSICERFRFPD